MRTPVHIITGFLGSGKTTFLNHFIRERLPERIFVIENECGATNVDGGLVIEGVEEVAELSAGCLCCSLADGLLDLLDEASKKRDQFDRMVIETTGIADPSSIVQVFLQDEKVERHFELAQVICLVDAALVEEWLEEAEEALRQIALADVVLINKADQVASADLLKVQGRIESINPHAKVYAGEQGVFPVVQILEAGTTKPESVEHVQHEHHEHSHDHHGHGNSHKITTFTLSFPHPLDLNRLHADLNHIVQLHRDQLYRVKGFIAIPSYPNRVILQSARSALIVTDGSPWETTTQREGRLVFIGRGLRREVFEELLGKHMVKPAVHGQ
ncbi:MAG: GTP-binding protein [Bacteroidota bacterium]